MTGGRRPTVVAVLAARVAYTESWLVSHPRAAAYPLVAEKHNQYLTVLIGGVDNTRLFDRGGELRSDWKATWPDYVDRYGSRRSGRLVARYLELLRAHDWRRTEEIEAFLRAVWRSRNPYHA